MRGVFYLCGDIQTFSFTFLGGGGHGWMFLIIKQETKGRKAYEEMFKLTTNHRIEVKTVRYHLTLYRLARIGRAVQSGGGWMGGDVGI